jgi:hypothetical protein
MFVVLIDGHEPFAVNPHQVCAVEGHAGRRDCMVIMANGGTKRVPLSVDEVIRRLSQAAPDNWLDAPKRKTK